MEMYHSTFQPALEEGVYEVKMLKHEYVANEKAPYIKFTFEVLTGTQKGRKLTDNRFEKGFGVMISHLRQQLGRENEEIVVQDFLNDLIKNETKFKIWVVKRTINNTPRTNFNFLEPIKEETPNVTVVDDTPNTAIVDDTPNTKTIE